MMILSAFFWMLLFLFVSRTFITYSDEHPLYMGISFIGFCGFCYWGFIFVYRIGSFIISVMGNL